MNQVSVTNPQAGHNTSPENKHNDAVCSDLRSASYNSAQTRTSLLPFPMLTVNTIFTMLSTFAKKFSKFVKFFTQILKFPTILYRAECHVPS